MCVSACMCAYMCTRVYVYMCVAQTITHLACLALISLLLALGSRGTEVWLRPGLGNRGPGDRLVILQASLCSLVALQTDSISRIIALVWCR